MRLAIFLFTGLLFIIGCKRTDAETTMPAKEILPTTEAYASVADTVYQPASPIAEEKGQLVTGGDTLNIVMSYTNDVAYTQKTGNSDEGVMLYRDAVVNIISSASDTIKIRKSDFIKHIPDEAYNFMIMQGVGTDMEINRVLYPFMIWFCQPDSDFCYLFDVKIKGKDLEITPVDEGEMGE